VVIHDIESMYSKYIKLWDITKPLVTITLLLIGLSSCTDQTKSELLKPISKISIHLDGSEKDSNTVSLRIDDTFGNSFYEVKSSSSGNEHHFEYRLYRPIIAQININNKENNVLIEPSIYQFSYSLDNNGYIKNPDVYHDYINSLAYLSEHNCGNATSLLEGIVCIDQYSARKRKLLEHYRANGMSDKHYQLEDTEIYYDRFKQYAQIALYRRGYISIAEDNSVVYDSITSMDMAYGQFYRSTNRAHALSFKSLLNRNLDDDVKAYNYAAFRELYHQHNRDTLLATHIYGYLHDNPYREQSLMDSLAKSSIPAFVESIKVNTKTGSTYKYNNDFWTDVEGNFLTHESLANKISLISFWFPGCRPCIKSIPQKNELVDHYKAQPNFQFMNINCDFSRSTWIQYLERYDMKGYHFFVPEALQESHDDYYELSAFPTYMLAIDGSLKRIEQYPIGSEELYQLIDNTLDIETAITE